MCIGGGGGGGGGGGRGPFIAGTNPGGGNQPVTKSLRQSNSALSNALRRRRTGASSARPRLGNTLLSGQSGIPDSAFVNTAVKSLIGG